MQTANEGNRVPPPSGHRVVPAAGERIAAQHPPRRKQPAAQHAVPLDRLGGIDRAGGGELAGRRQQRGDHPFVPSERRDGRPLEQFFCSPAMRSSNLPISALALFRDSLSTDCLQRMMVSLPSSAGCGWVLTYSRRTRLARLRAAGPPSRCGTNTEHRVIPSALSRKNSANRLPAIRRPLRKRASILYFPRMAPKGLRGSDRKAFSPFGAPGIDDLPSRFGFHPRAEPVFPFPPAVVRIVCRLHLYPPRFFRSRSDPGRD